MNEILCSCSYCDAFFFFLRNKEKIAEHNVVSSFVVLAFECCHVSLGT